MRYSVEAPYKVIAQVSPLRAAVPQRPQVRMVKPDHDVALNSLFFVLVQHRIRQILQVRLFGELSNAVVR